MSADGPDLVIAGAGGGLAGALRAAELGLDVLVVEVSEHFRRGNNTSMSTAMVPGAGTRFQAAAGIDDSPDLYVSDIKGKTHGEADQQPAEALAQVSARLVEWLVDSVGLDLHLVTDFHYPGHSVDRCHTIEGRHGTLLLDHLVHRVRDTESVDLLVPAKLVDVRLDDDGRVAAAVLETPDGSTEEVPTRAVLLATNGYGADRSLVAEHLPEIADAVYHGSEASRGDALRIGQALGADVAFLDAYQGHGALAQRTSTLVGWATIMHGGIIVGADGRRFGNETSGYSEYAAVIAAQPGAAGWIVLDQRIHDACLVVHRLPADRRRRRAGLGRRRGRPRRRHRPAGRRTRRGAAGHRRARPRRVLPSGPVRAHGVRGAPPAAVRRGQGRPGAVPHAGRARRRRLRPGAAPGRHADRGPVRLGRRGRRHLRSRGGGLPRRQRPAAGPRPGLPRRRGRGPHTRRLGRPGRPTTHDRNRGGTRMTRLNTLVKNVTVVRPETGADGGEQLDIGITDGTFSRLEPNIPAEDADVVVDGRGLLAFPGVVDGHQHWGIYNSLEDDTDTESRASAQGGVTTGLTYMRTGQYYLNTGGPYREFFPKVLAASEGRSFIDYAFHLAPMSREHIDEIPSIITGLGVTSFKIFMFYGSHGLHGASSDQSAFLMIPPDERYDVAHFEFVMRGIQKARAEHPELADQISLSLHCETAEIMTAYTKMVQAEGSLSGLAAYSASRPPHSEGLAVTTASFLADETGLPNINLLHLSSAKALTAAMRMQGVFPHVNFRREVTIGHLLADITTAHGLGGKVNPPLRPRDDVEALWEHMLAGNLDWVVSDHACCKDEQKFGDPRDDIFAAKSGFGGAEYLLPGLVSEGSKRGLSYKRIAELTSWAPARRYALPTKGTIAVGYDADFCLVDPSATWTVHAEDSESTQEYTPFEGFELGARVTDTWVRGHQVLDRGNVVGSPTGRFLRRGTVS